VRRTKALITHNWSLRLNTECTPLERHGVLYFIEQGLMTRTGKRYEWELGVQSGLPLMATINSQHSQRPDGYPTLSQSG
jgi:hypothetical protein